MNFSIYNIPEQKDIFRIKNTLISLGLKYNSKQKFYYNDVALESSDEERLLDILEGSKYQFTFKDSVELNLDPIETNYKIIHIDKDNIFIALRNNNKKEFYLNRNNNMITMFDIENQEIKVVESNSKENDFILNLLDLLNSNYQIKSYLPKLNKILFILSKNYIKELDINEKIKAFKHHVIDKIVKSNKDGFLCNCIGGFYPETKFYIKSNRIYSSYLENFVSKEQEEKIWNFLHKNQNRIGVEYTPTFKDLFIGRKIIVTDQNGIEHKCVINKVKKIEDSSLLEVSVYNGLNIYKIKKYFTESELLNLIQKAR